VEVSAYGSEGACVGGSSRSLPAGGSAPGSGGAAADPEQGGRGGSGWFTGVAGRAWSFVTNEAAVLDATGAPPPLPRPKLNLEVQVELQGETLHPKSRTGVRFC
jgi:hypothetical protein